MKLNKKGVSMTEMLVSVILISIVLTLLMSLFVNVRFSYNNSKINADYKVVQNEILMAVYQDIEKYGVSSIDAENLYSNGLGQIKITFNDSRDTYPGVKISKILKLESLENTCKISYSYEDSTNLSNTERAENIIKKLPENSTCSLNSIGPFDDNLRNIKINIVSQKGIDYNVNIWFKEG